MSGSLPVSGSAREPTAWLARRIRKARRCQWLPRRGRGTWPSSPGETNEHGELSEWPNGAASKADGRPERHGRSNRSLSASCRKNSDAIDLRAFGRGLITRAAEAPLQRPRSSADQSVALRTREREGRRFESCRGCQFRRRCNSAARVPVCRAGSGGFDSHQRRQKRMACNSTGRVADS